MVSHALAPHVGICAVVASFGYHLIRENYTRLALRNLVVVVSSRIRLLLILAPDRLAMSFISTNALQEPSL